MSFHIGIDVGGTFTDFAATDGSGRHVTSKTPTVSGDQAAGIVAGLEGVAERYGLELGDLLRRAQVVLLGTTIATNTMLEYNGSRVGLLCTKGFRDSIELRRSYREDLFDLRYPPPVPICRRRQRLGVTERIDYRGEVVIPLDEDEARAAARRLRELEVEAVAVCLLFGHVNPVHEERVAAILAEEIPGAYVTLGSDVLPEVREFERLSTTLVNAYTTPALRSYLRRLRELLGEHGFAGDLLITQSNGGVVEEEVAAERGVAAVRSGPASGVVAAGNLGRLCGADNVIGVDMGGTSYDVSLVRGGVPQLRSDAWVSRYRVALPMLDIHAIGTGGGSIGWLDPAGALKVGPRSAGAQPGPACYGKGGTEPTVTDVDLVLGYLDTSLLRGEVALSRELAERAIERRIARPLGLDVLEAAIGMLRVVNTDMNNGVRYVSVARGHDPRDFALVAYGGAGAVHAGMQAPDLGVSRVLVPKDASVFCALGALTSDLKVSLTHPYYSRGSDASAGQLAGIFTHLHERAETSVHRSRDSLAELRGQPFIDARYVGQTHEVTVPVDGNGGPLDEAALRAAIARFHELHELLYSFKNPDQEIELLNLRYDLIGVRRKPPGAEGGGAREAEPPDCREVREAFFEVDGAFRPLETPVFDGDELRPGHVLEGPCIVSERYTTVVVCPGQRARLNEQLVYDIEVAA
jgi:N-methylhydantoinase A